MCHKDRRSSGNLESRQITSSASHWSPDPANVDLSVRRSTFCPFFRIHKRKMPIHNTTGVNKTWYMWKDRTQFKPPKGKTSASHKLSSGIWRHVLQGVISLKILIFGNYLVENSWAQNQLTQKMLLAAFLFSLVRLEETKYDEQQFSLECEQITWIVVFF